MTPPLVSQTKPIGLHMLEVCRVNMVEDDTVLIFCENIIIGEEKPSPRRDLTAVFFHRNDT